ncbi:helix-turn-helix domain-containing protein [Chryseobacterium oncorhynchi]|nr:helix-turn-helix transcriptional regulator [Chryseobacterium oncorhynchi]
MGLKKTEQKEFAKFLFTEKNLTQKEVAEKAGVTEKTIAKWISANDGEWKKLKKSLMATKANQINLLYEQLDRLNDHITTRKITYDVPEHLLKPIKVQQKDGSEKLEYQKYDEKDYPVKIGNYPTSREADMIVKITNAIKKLENDVSVGETVKIAMTFCEYVRDIDFPLSRKISELFDMFIREQMNHG